MYFLVAQCTCTYCNTCAYYKYVSVNTELKTNLIILLFDQSYFMLIKSIFIFSIKILTFYNKLWINLNHLILKIFYFFFKIVL